MDDLRVGRGKGLAVPCLKKARILWKVYKGYNLDGFFETNYATELKEKKHGEDGEITLIRDFIISAVH